MNGNEILNVVVQAALKGSAILVIALIATLAWRSASAAAKHLVWTLSVALCVALPVIAAALKWLDAPAIPVSSWQPPVNTAPLETTSSSTVTTPETAFTEPQVQVEPTVIVTSEPWKPSLTSVWLVGMIVSLLPFFAAVLKIRAVARKSRLPGDDSWRVLIARTPAIAHLADRVQILESESAAMPMTWGIVKPTLLVPASAREWPDWQRRNVLLHELAHVERHDCFTQLIAQIACSIYWFNPLAWVAAHRMRVERELACDDRVIAAGAKASDYATNLLEVARSLRAPSFTSSSAIAMARPSQLSGRLLAVLDSRRNRRSVTRRIAFAAVITAVTVSLPLAALTPRAEAAVITKTPAVIAAVQIPTLSTAVSALDSKVAKLSDAVAVLNQQTVSCWNGKDASASVNISSDNDDDRNSYRVRYSRDDCSLELRADGKFTLRPDLSDIESMSSNGWLRLEERDGRTTRRMEIRRADNGSIDHQYWVNGDRKPYDDSARAWLASTLLSVERRTAFAADTRVPQLYKNGGLNAVLNEISQMSGDYAAAKYFSTLLDMGVSLDANNLNAVVRRAASDLASSDYYLSEVLGKLGNQSAANETTWQIFTDASSRMSSDYYRSELLKKVLSKGRLSDETVGKMLQSASAMKSDYYLSDLLKSIASRYALNANTRQYYADALRKIDSDYYRADLIGSLGSGDWDARTSQYVLASIAEIKSDYYRSESLEKLVKDNHVNDWNAYFTAATGIQSDYYKKTALVAALRRAPLTREIVLGVLNAVPRMRSDSEMAEVLKAVSDRYRIDDSLRPAYEKAADAINSDYYRGAAYSALRRSGTN